MNVAPTELYICCLDWLDLFSVQQRHKCFLPCKTWLFFLFLGSLCSSWALLVIFLFLFYIHYRILNKPSDLVSSLDIFLHLNTLPTYVLGLFAALCTCQLFFARLPAIFIFLTFEASQGCWDILFNPLGTVADLHFFGNTGLIKCQDVGVGLYLFITLSRAGVISSLVANTNSLLLITPLEVFSL